MRKPSEEVLAAYSANPRNAAGDWYEDHIAKLLKDLCGKLDLRTLEGAERRLAGSKVYLTDKVVDVVLRCNHPRTPGRETLGLELKFLGGQGSLVAPKSFVDAVDFTNRPYHCMYAIDGEGWLEGGKTPFIDFLARWWEFTCSAYLERTLSRYFG